MPELSIELILLKNAAIEITNLRRRNELMSARLQMFDDVNAILHTQVASKNEGMSPDLVSQIDKHIAEVKNSQPKNESSNG